MFYIKLDEDMSLIITVLEPIYRGDNLSRKITYLLPLKIGDVDMLTAVVYLNYIRADGTADIVRLDRMEEKYNESYLQYTLPITCKLSKYPGEVCTWMQIYSGSPSNPIIQKSGECILQILESKNIDDYIDDFNITALYQMQHQIDTGFDQVEEELSKKADNIVFNETDSSLQLMAGDEPVGDRIYLSMSPESTAVTDAVINENGELVLLFADGSEKNLGSVVGKDGAVYVPHISERTILTFTIEDEPKGIPDPVDLNPHDEWSGVDDSTIETSYIWEPM